MLDIVRLRVLAAVAAHGSVTKAAKALHYSQSSISHHLARLEASTGAKLIQHVGRGIRLTPEGNCSPAAPSRSSAGSTRPTPSWRPSSGCRLAGSASRRSARP